MPKEKELTREFFRKQGSIGGKKAFKNLSKERRSEIARMGGKARWQKERAIDKHRG